MNTVRQARKVVTSFMITLCIAHVITGFVGGFITTWLVAYLGIQDELAISIVNALAPILFAAAIYYSLSILEKCIELVCKIPSICLWFLSTFIKFVVVLWGYTTRFRKRIAGRIARFRKLVAKIWNEEWDKFNKK